MTAKVSPGYCASATAALPPHAESHDLDKVADLIRDYKEVETPVLLSCVQQAERDLYSDSNDVWLPAKFFFTAILERGTKDQFLAIMPFFLRGCKGPGPNPQILFFSLIDEVIKSTRFDDVSEQVTQLLLRECESNNEWIRNKALESFGTLLRDSKMRPHEKAVVKAATRAAASVLERPWMPNMFNCWNLFGQATCLLEFQLVKDHLEHNGDEIVRVVQGLLEKGSLYLRLRGAEISAKIKERMDAARSLLPSGIETQVAVDLAADNPRAVIEDPKLFWAIFCKNASLTSYTPLFTIQQAKGTIEKLRPFFLEESISFFAHSRSCEGYFTDPIEDPQFVDLRKRKTDYCPVFFQWYVQPYLPALANSLGYECAIQSSSCNVLIRAMGMMISSRDILTRDFVLHYQLTRRV